MYRFLNMKKCKRILWIALKKMKQKIVSFDRQIFLFQDPFSFFAIYQLNR